jgi:processive 1,2-diacylglycerol beta-glucosyltransferase
VVNAVFDAASTGGSEGRSRGSQLRVLVLFCEEGEGHSSAAHTLANELRGRGAWVGVHDAMREGLGRVIPFLSRDTYRLQVRWLRWSYGLEYALFTQVAPTRAIARGGLKLFGGAPLQRVIGTEPPDVVVSTHPAVTNVLGGMRARGELAVPVVATITDFGVHPLWAHPAVDLHLVMHEHLVPMVEEIAGVGSARVVRPIVASEFQRQVDREHARRALGLSATARVALISGGGWGVGDLERITNAALEVEDLEVVALCGRNEALRRRLDGRLGTEPRLRVLPFTDQMPELLSAADVLVDATVGITCLEAISSGCPVVVFGMPPGHSRYSARVLSELGLVQAPRSLDELLGALASPPPPRGAWLASLGRTPSAGEAILSAHVRADDPVNAPRGSRRAAAAGALVASAQSVRRLVARRRAV